MARKFPNRAADYAHCDEKGLFFTHPKARCIDIEYPGKLEKIPFLVRFLATIGYETGDFEGALLWFNEWGVWNTSDEGIGYRIIEAMNTSAGQPKAFDAGPGHLFRADELTGGRWNASSADDLWLGCELLAALGSRDWRILHSYQPRFVLERCDSYESVLRHGVWVVGVGRHPTEGWPRIAVAAFLPSLGHLLDSCCHPLPSLLQRLRQNPRLAHH